MLTEQVAQGADALSWNIATSRWLRRELQACEAEGADQVVMSKGDLLSILGGLAGVQEVLADYLRQPGYLDDVPPPPLKPRVKLRVIDGGKP
jgi:hypothetical protein